MWDTLWSYKESDGIAERSSFLVNRRGSDPLVQTWGQKASVVMSRPMSYIDTFTADSLVRARYRQNLKRGMSEDAAMADADAFAALFLNVAAQDLHISVFGDEILRVVAPRHDIGQCRNDGGRLFHSGSVGTHDKFLFSLS